MSIRGISCGAMFLDLLGSLDSWVLRERVINLLFGWTKWLGNNSLDIWNLAMLCLMKIIWWERNNCIFEDLESLGGQLLVSFVETLFDWSWTLGSISREPIPMFIESLSFLHNSFGYFVQLLHEVVSFNKLFLLLYIYIYIYKCSWEGVIVN